MHRKPEKVPLSTLGAQVAALLSSRQTVTALNLQRILPICLQSGAAGLAWRQLQDTSLAGEAQELQNAYRKEALYAALHEREISRCATLFAENNIRCLFGKGWRVSRCYPGWGLRACGDIDVYVTEAQHKRAQALIGDDSGWAISIDLHKSCAEFSGESLEALWERAEVLKLRGVECRFIPPEEHLCLLAFHSLRHGLARPVWLLDIGFWLRAFEGLLDWRFLEELTELQRHYLKAVLWLSHATFGFPIPERALPMEAPPRWVLREVYRSWGQPYWARVPIVALWREPLALAREVPRHWPNPIESVYERQLTFHQRGLCTQPRVFLQRSQNLFHRLLRGPT